MYIFMQISLTIMNHILKSFSNKQWSSIHPSSYQNKLERMNLFTM